MSELELAALLRKTIQDSGKSLGEIRDGCGVSTPQLSRFMRQERSLSLDSVEKLLRYFGLRVQAAASQIEQVNDLLRNKGFKGVRCREVADGEQEIELLLSFKNGNTKRLDFQTAIQFIEAAASEEALLKSSPKSPSAKKKGGKK